MKFEQGNLYFTKIYVIESLSIDDRLTGSELFEDIIVRRLYSDPNTSAELIKIDRKNDFKAAFESIYKDVINENVLPYIHFESHGNKNGLVLSSNEQVDFDLLMSMLLKINLASKNNLFISISACWGGHIQFQIDIRKPIPIRGFIGPMDTVFEKDLLTNFTRFFDVLLLTDDFEKAINALNLVSSVQFHHLNAEAFYELVTKSQIEKYGSEDKYNELLLKKGLKDTWKNNKKVKAIYHTKGRFRKAMKKSDVVNIKDIKQEMRNRFLHINLEN